MKTETPEKFWDMFLEVVTKAGLEPKCCHVTYWQIKGVIRNETQRKPGNVDRSEKHWTNRGNVRD